MLSWALAANLLAATSSTRSNVKNLQDERKRAAVEMFRSYSKLEEKQDYIHIYNLLSSRFRQDLQREDFRSLGIADKIKTASGYNRLRLASEARWSKFRILKIDSMNDGYKFLVEAKVEESGVIEDVKKTYYLIQEHGKWKIDRWTTKPCALSPIHHLGMCALYFKFAQSRLLHRTLSIPVASASDFLATGYSAAS